MMCPKCRSQRCEVTADVKNDGKDFSIVKGALGSVLFGGYGAAFGIQKKRTTQLTTYWTCKRCGHIFCSR